MTKEDIKAHGEELNLHDNHLGDADEQHVVQEGSMQDTPEDNNENVEEKK